MKASLISSPATRSSERRGTKRPGRQAAGAMPGLGVGWAPVLLAGLAIGLGAAAHAGALANPFVYDDRVTILDNPSISRLSDLGGVLRHTPFRPLVNLSYAIDYASWGLRPFGYHLTNLMLHLANVGLVFALAYLAPVPEGSVAGGRGHPRSPSARPRCSPSTPC